MNHRVEKVMSISRREFEASLAALDPNATLSATGWARVTSGGITAEIQFQPLPARVLGGLLSLPQASVQISFADAPNVADARVADFLRRFDIAFQRGGG